MKVLIAEDTKFVRSLLSEWITELGHEVFLAEDGEKAERAAETQEFQIAIVDWAMPKKNGFELIETLRKSPRSQYMHIIVVTGVQEPEMLIKALESGADDFMRKPINRAVFLARFRAAARIVAMREDIIRLAATDALTGVANRRSFFSRSAELLANARRRHSPVSVMLADIDFFKKINDVHGHAAGDRALQSFAGVCRAQLRPLDLIGRLGGEEFAVLLPDTTLSGARKIADRLRTAVEAASTTAENGDEFSMTVSIGLAEAAPGVDVVDAALAAADRALYRAKGTGRNRVEQASASDAA